MWKCKNCGGEVFEHSIVRVDINWETEEYKKLVYKCEKCESSCDSYKLETIAEWVE